MKILEELKNLIPPLSSSEIELLEASLLDDGCRDALITWEGYLIDGHHRLAICEAHGIEYRTIEKKFDDLNAVKLWMIDNQGGRRNLSDGWKIALYDTKRKINLEIGRAQQGRRTDILPPSGKTFEPHNSVEIQAEELGWSTGKTKEANFVWENADEETKEKLKSGEMAVKTAYKKTKKEKSKQKAKQEHMKLVEEAKSVIPSDRWNVFTGDINTARLEKNSFDAIITDPPYPQDCLPLWGALGEFAKYHLKVGGVLLAMTGSLYMPQIIEMLGEHLTYQWVLACVLPGQHSEVHAAWVNNQMWKMVLVYRNGGDLVNIGSDLFQNESRDKDFHEWGQGVSGYLWQIEHFTKPNDLICDPFLGGGTTGEAALLSSRRFIGLDNDAEKVAISKARLSKVLEAQ